MSKKQQDSDRKLSQFYNEAAIGYFRKLTDLPLPLSDPEIFDYYLSLFDPYYGTKAKWELFMADIQLFKGNLVMLMQECKSIKDKLVAYFNKHAEQFTKAYDFVLPPSERKFKLDPKKSIYQPTNIGKWFLSVDVKEANYQSFTFLMNGKSNTSEAKVPSTWGELVKNFTQTQTLQNEKTFRSIVFSKSNINKVYAEVLRSLFVQPALLRLKSKESYQSPVMIATDEIIYELPDDMDKDTVIKEVQSLLDSSQIWNIELFRLKLLSQKHDYYTKELWNGKRKLKCVRDCHLCQAIKWDRGEEVVENDLYFIYPGTKECVKLRKPTLRESV